MSKDTEFVPTTYSSSELGVAFLDSFSHVLKNLSEADHKEALTYTLNLVGPYNLHTRLSFDSFPSLMSEIYSSVVIRDFISTVHSVFIGRWLQGRGKALLYTLIDDLALSMSYDFDLGLTDTDDNGKQIRTYCAIPPQVEQDLVPSTTMSWLIQANPILITLILMQQYINLESFGIVDSVPAKQQ